MTTEKGIVVEALEEARRYVCRKGYDPYGLEDIDKAIRVAEIEARAIELLRGLDRIPRVAGWLQKVDALLAEHSEATND